MNTNQIREDAGEMGQTVRDQVEESADDLRETAKEWKSRIAEKSRRAAEAANSYVHDNPWPVIASVGIATFLLGFLMGRSRD